MKEKSIRLERLKSGSMSLLDTHDSYAMENRLGVILSNSFRIEGGKAYATVQISRNGRGENLLKDLQDGMPFPVSVGYRIHAYEETDGTGDALPRRLITDWEPLELSAVPVPADAGAHSRSAGQISETNPCLVTHPNRKIQETTTMDKQAAAKNYKGGELTGFAAAFGLVRNQDETDDAFSKRLLDMFDAEDEAAARAAADVDAKAKARAKADSDAAALAARSASLDDKDDADDVAKRKAQITDAVREAISALSVEDQAAETKRKADILALAKRCGLEENDDVVRSAHSGKESFDQFREKLLERLSSNDANVRTNHAGVRTVNPTEIARRDAATDYLLARGDRSKPMEGAIREFRGSSLLDIARRALEWEGVRTDGMTRNEVAQRALSTGDFPIILSNVANKTLAAAYEAAPKTFQPFVRTMNLSDFKPRQIVRKGLAPQMQKKNENGEYVYGSYKESMEQIKLVTYGVAVKMTREMLINDDLGAFTGLAAEFGQSAATLESDIVYGAIMANPALLQDATAVFHATHGNLGTGVPSALSETSLTTARVAMSKQTDLDGKTTLNISPNWLLIPFELETTAEKLLTSITPNVTASVVPAFIRSLKPVTDARLSNGISKQRELGVNVTGSATAWYLISSQTDNIVIAYMEGQNGVYTDEQIDFKTDGMEIKARHDFGAAWGDFRGSYKSNGA
jgi:phage head maturation protease